jgi:hypothetical protein
MNPIDRSRETFLTCTCMPWVVLHGQQGGGASGSVVGDEMIVVASTTRGSLGV